MPPTVSVVIPVFNRRAAVRCAIKSVLAQTFQDFEIVVVDDGSTDGTPVSVAEFADRRIRLLRHERNRGGSAARNTGIRASSAPYVAFLDSDDEWLPTKLQRQLEVFARSNKEQLGLVYTGAEWIYPDGRAWLRIPRRELDLTRALLTENVIGETSVGMVRRRALDAIGGFDESLPSCQDMDLWLRISEQFEANIASEALVRVMKADDDRITNNVVHALRGRALFCQKHREKMIRHGVLYAYLRKSGWWQQRRMRDSRLARRLYLESLAANPIAPLTYVLMLSAYLPMPCQDVMARCKQLLAGFLRLRPKARVPSNSSNLTSVQSSTAIHQRSRRRHKRSKSRGRCRSRCEGGLSR
jgi:glycosyltransferase involved in cell wall biosynthesis